MPSNALDLVERHAVVAPIVEAGRTGRLVAGHLLGPSSLPPFWRYVVMPGGPNAIYKPHAAIKLQTWFLGPAASKRPAPKPVNEPMKESRAEVPARNEPDHKLISTTASLFLGGNDPNKLLGFELQNIDHTHLYLEQRGITEATARHFGVGLFLGKGSMSLRCVIPIHNVKGELVAYAGRSIDGTEPRYKFPLGFRKLELFNLHRVAGEVSVVLVEGFFDCMKVTQAGFPCVALMGSTMSSAQEDLLADHFGEVIIMLDGDVAGRAATEKIEERLRRVVYKVRVVSLADGMEPDQLTTDELVDLLQ